MVGTGKRDGRAVSTTRSRIVSMRKDRAVILGGDDKEDKKTNAGSAMSQLERLASHLGPMLLSRGMTGRVLGARIPELDALNPEEIEADLMKINKHYSASVQYAQQLYMFRNRLQGVGVTTEPVASNQAPKAGVNSKGTNARRVDGIPVKSNGKRLPRSASKLDPEEEKLNQALRKRIAQSETKREVLESQYVSLRAHYVHECKNLETMKSNAVDTLKLLQSLVRSKSNVVALLRAKITLANDIMKFIASRRVSPQAMDINDGKIDHLAWKALWITIETKLQEAVRDCKDKMENINGSIFKSGNQVDSGASDASENSDNTLSKAKTRGASNAESIRICWDASLISGTPSGVQLLLSPLSRAPDRAAAVAYGCLLNSDSKDLTWLEKNLPRSLETLEESNPCELSILKSLQDEAKELEKSIEKTIKDNAAMNSELRQRRKQSDRACARMALLRTETEAVVMRHNVILETPEARARADAMAGSDRFSKNEEGVVSTGDDTESNDTEVPFENEVIDNMNDGDSSNDGEEHLSQDDSDSDEDQRSAIDIVRGVVGMESANNSDMSDTDNEHDGTGADEIDVAADEQSLPGNDNSTDEGNNRIPRGRTRIQVRLTRNNIISNEKVQECDENSDEFDNGGNRQKRDSEFLSADDMSSVNKRARRRNS